MPLTSPSTTAVASPPCGWIGSPTPAAAAPRVGNDAGGRAMGSGTGDRHHAADLCSGPVRKDAPQRGGADGLGPADGIDHPPRPRVRLPLEPHPYDPAQ